MTATATAAAIDNAQLAAIAACLLGVLLSRLVYVGRESRRSGKGSKLRDTLPLTLLAMLIAGAFVADHDINMWKATFVGIGVGWVPEAILDIIGDWVINVIRGIPGLFRGQGQPPTTLGDMTGLHDLTPHMNDLVELADQSDAHHQRQQKKLAPPSPPAAPAARWDDPAA